ncbi:MAG: hypothetical protein LBD24_08680 [Spirochaetaceae bacterium]|jgi:hypothetical protein|nr:hypothetical protein [Spirochaetaceae bacterium]
MKTLLCALLALCLAPARARPGEVTLSGLLDTKASFVPVAGPEADRFSFGFEEYANLRLKTDAGEYITFHAACNLIAAAGIPARTAEAIGASGSSALLSTNFVAGENYAAALELERLYCRITRGALDVDAGLMRLAFGYGTVFSSSDYLNPRNPLFPDARPRGVLGISAAYYPEVPGGSGGTDIKVQTFAAAPRNPLDGSGRGALFGALGECHWDAASLQGMYHFEAPDRGSGYGVHRAGLSVKTDAVIRRRLSSDIIIGLTLDALYQYNHEALTGIDGLSVSAGADYSFYDGKWYVAAAYLFSGRESTTSRIRTPAGFANRHYLYALCRYHFTDYTRAGLHGIAGFDDLSFTPVATVEHEVFQGFTLSLTCQVPLDRDLFTGNGKRGEFGPLPPDAAEGAYARITLKALLRL